MSAQLELLLGGARSGKSYQAEQRAIESNLDRIYVATATIEDEEMALRIKAHQERRKESEGAKTWKLIEEPLHLDDALQSVHGNSTCVLVDCLTLWISNCLHNKCWDSERAALLASLPGLTGRIIFVSNEVGMGIVPMGKISRDFVDASGSFHQELARHCQRVTMMIAGLPIDLKST